MNDRSAALAEKIAARRIGRLGAEAISLGAAAVAKALGDPSLAPKIADLTKQVVHVDLQKIVALRKPPAFSPVRPTEDGGVSTKMFLEYSVDDAYVLPRVLHALGVGMPADFKRPLGYGFSVAQEAVGAMRASAWNSAPRFKKLVMSNAKVRAQVGSALGPTWDVALREFEDATAHPDAGWHGFYLSFRVNLEMRPPYGRSSASTSRT